MGCRPGQTARLRVPRLPLVISDPSCAEAVHMETRGGAVTLPPAALARLPSACHATFGTLRATCHVHLGDAHTAARTLPAASAPVASNRPSARSLADVAVLLALNIPVLHPSAKQRTQLSYGNALFRCPVSNGQTSYPPYTRPRSPLPTLHPLQAAVPQQAVCAAAAGPQLGAGGTEQAGGGAQGGAGGWEQGKQHCITVPTGLPYRPLLRLT